MGNFAENLNLGNRFRPPPPGLLAIHTMALYYRSTAEVMFHHGVWFDIGLVNT